MIRRPGVVLEPNGSPTKFEDVVAHQHLDARICPREYFSVSVDGATKVAPHTSLRGSSARAMCFVNSHCLKRRARNGFPSDLLQLVRRDGDHELRWQGEQISHRVRCVAKSLVKAFALLR